MAFKGEIDIVATRDIICPQGKTVYLHRIGPHAALLSDTEHIDPLRVTAVPLDPFAHLLQKPIACDGCSGCAVIFPNEESAFPSWNVTLDFSTQLFKQAALVQKT